MKDDSASVERVQRKYAAAHGDDELPAINISPEQLSFSSPVLWPKLSLIVLSLSLIYIIAQAYIAPLQEPVVLLTAQCLAALSLVSLIYYIRQVYDYYTQQKDVLMSVFSGNLSARMPRIHGFSPVRGIHSAFNQFLNQHQGLNNAHIQRALLQQQLMDEKKDYLNTLYALTSTINASDNVEALLKGFLRTLSEIVTAEAATVRLYNDSSNEMSIVASTGLNEAQIKCEADIVNAACQCLTVCDSGASFAQKIDTQFMHKGLSQQHSSSGAFDTVSIDVTGDARTEASVSRQKNAGGCQLIEHEGMKVKAATEMYAVPMTHRGKVLGVYNLFLTEAQLADVENKKELLDSIGLHLGMAIEQANAEAHAKAYTLIEERTRIAHELHDSLAQTLASMRYGIRMMDANVQSGQEAALMENIDVLSKSVENAYLELRSIITHFRAPDGGKDIVTNIERIAKRFEIENDIDLMFFQNWQLNACPAEVALEATRVVQEALNNVKKYAEAENLGLMMYSTEDGRCSILIEDDGLGFDTTIQRTSDVGEHIGLSIMQARANKIDGELAIESEIGEGTLITLNFEVDVDSK